MIGIVQFIGGELDGEMREMQRLSQSYRHPYLRRRQSWNPLPIDEIPTPQHTEYVLTHKDGQVFYVERELMHLSEKAGIDPRNAQQ